MLENCTKNNLFLFNGQSYLQIDGCPMGGCVSPTLANTFLSHHEPTCLNNCPSECTLYMYVVYICTF